MERRLCKGCPRRYLCCWQNAEPESKARIGLGRRNGRLKRGRCCTVRRTRIIFHGRYKLLDCINMSLVFQQVEPALRHFRSSDPVLQETIKKVGPFRLQLQRDRFQALVRSIISQQISTSAARTIRERLAKRLAPEKISAAAITELTDRQLRSVGLSKQKSSYLRDLSQKVLDNQLCLNQVGRFSDEKVIEKLTQVKGIGRWTAQMFLMFCLGRPDVLPYDDLGIRSALRKLYKLKALPDKAATEKIASAWRPYATIACWYCWRSLDLPNKRGPK